MKTAALALVLALACPAVSAQDMRPGIASIAMVSTEADGRYGMDGKIVDARRLKRTLVELDAQLAIGHLHLRKGGAEVSAEQLAEIRAIADEIGARLMVEKAGRMESAEAVAEPVAGS